MQNEQKIKGAWLSLITPFDSAKKFDASAAMEYIKLMEQHDFKGYLLGGSVGEGMLMSNTELAEYIALVRKLSNKPIMICIASFNYELARERMLLDYDYLCVTPCIYFKPHADATVEYFKMVAASAHGPIILYNNPGRVGCAITEQIYDALVEKTNIIGMKECNDEQLDHLSNKHTQWEWLTGNDDYMANPFFMNNGNANGVISTLGSIAPECCIQLWNLRQDHDARTKYVSEWSNLCKLAYSIPNPQAVKIVLAEWGIIQPYFRAQFNPLPKFEHASAFAKIG